MGTQSGWSVAALVVAAVLLLIGLAGLVAHFRAPGRGWMLGVSAFSPYLMLGAPLALIVLAVSREWLGTTVALIVTAVAISTQVPLYTATNPPAHAATLITMTSNLKLGGADPASVVDAVRRHNVDVLMLQELTPEEQQRLSAAGLDRLLPYHVSDPRAYAMGTGLWSRYPLVDEVKRTDFSLAFVTANVRIPGARKTVSLAALHMPGPYPSSLLWHYDIAHLPSVLPTLGGGSGTVVVGGDFNSTPDLHQFRQLLRHGYQDAANQAGAGMTRTYPSNSSVPPMIAIDHVLTRDAVATSAKTVRIPGTDHRALVVQVAVPRG